jgi:hypothetical protein
MPPWGGNDCIQEETNPVIAYVKSLNGIVSPNENPRALPFEASAGRDLFFDPTMELGACSNCHSFDGKGISVAPIGHLPADVAGLRNLERSGRPSQTKNRHGTR